MRHGIWEDLLGLGDKASGKFECLDCDATRGFIGEREYGRGCQHLNTPFWNANLTHIRWTRTRDRRLQTERQICSSCKASQPIGEMIVLENEENAWQPIWKCLDDVVCYAHKVVDRQHYPRADERQKNERASQSAINHR